MADDWPPKLSVRNRFIVEIPLELRVWRSYEHCPECGDRLVKREPHGGQDFEPFMGCFSWPGCEFTRPLQADGTAVPPDPLDDLSWIT